MKELVFLLEEQSAKVMLEALMPQIIPSDVVTRYITFEGKQDLEKQLVRKIRLYQNPHARFLVLRDLDSHPDCRELKMRLVHLCSAAGRPDTIVRLACRELESFYLADLAAVEQGLGLKGLAKKQHSRTFRMPDTLGSPSQQLQILTKGRYQKISGSRMIGKWLDISNTRSTSFAHLMTGIRRLLATPPPHESTG